MSEKSEKIVPEIARIKADGVKLGISDFDRKPSLPQYDILLETSREPARFIDELAYTQPYRESFFERQTRIGTELADMNQASMVKAKPDQRTAVGTFALGGCTGIVVQFENPANPLDRGAIVAHYDPMSIDFGFHEQQFGSLLTDIATQGMHAEAVIVSPGVGDPRSPTGYMPSELVSGTIQRLTDFIKDRLGQDTQVSELGYHTLTSDDPNQGTILVEFPKGQDPKLLIDGRTIRKI